MQHKLLFLLLALCGFTGLFGQSQDSVRLVINDVTVAGGDEIFCLDVVAISFPDIAAIQFSFEWETDELDFVETRYGANPLSLSSGTTFMPADSTVGVTKTTEDLSGITLDSGTVIMQLCFRARDGVQVANISFDAYLPAEFVQEGSFTPFPNSVTDGTVTVDPQVSVAAEPIWGREVALYPNPYTAGPLTISGNLPALDRIRVFSANGRSVASFSGSGRQLDLSGLPAGTYGVRLESGGEFVTRRVVVRR